jgi:hypothetical protein
MELSPAIRVNRPCIKVLPLLSIQIEDTKTWLQISYPDFFNSLCPSSNLSIANPSLVPHAFIEIVFFPRKPWNWHCQIKSSGHTQVMYLYHRRYLSDPHTKVLYYTVTIFLLFTTLISFSDFQCFLD